MRDQNESSIADNKFIADGRRQVEESGAYQEQVAEIRARIEEKYQPELEQANLFQKWFVSQKIRREIRREVEHLLPKDVLFLKQST